MDGASAEGGDDSSRSVGCQREGGDASHCDGDKEWREPICLPATRWSRKKRADRITALVTMIPRKRRWKEKEVDCLKVLL